MMEDGSTEFVLNQYAWNKEANVIYIESPAGVGFSLCPNASECVFNDNSTADDNIIALAFLFTEKFPELHKNDLWLSGESYAGIYVPSLASRIHNHTMQQMLHLKNYLPNFKGFLVGNAVTNWKYDTTQAFIEMAYSHQLIDPKLYFDIKKNCPEYL